MRILMLGAGGVGGYFGGRMVQTGSDVTFLVREGRAAQLEAGLRIESPHGDATIPVSYITGPADTGPFDVIALSCKSYGLAGALEAIAPFVREGVFILPLLNGFGHLDAIAERFPEAIVWGGSAGVIATLTEDGVVRQMHPNQLISAGLRPAQPQGAETLAALIAEMKAAQITAFASPDIEGAMWEKWTFLTTLAAATCLMRGSTGQILATDYGKSMLAALFDECIRTAIAEGCPPSPNHDVDYRGMLFDPNGIFTASMMRDMDAGGPTEADHIIGDMIARAARHGIETPMLKVGYTRLQVHEAARAK